MWSASSPVSKLRTTVLGSVPTLFVFTAVVNLLLLVQPIYMLQVYDRVLAAASYETLIYTSVIAAAALMLLGVLDAIRGMVCSRIAARMEVEGGPSALAASMIGMRANLGDVQPLRDLATVRNFISNRAILAFLDLPFVPFFTLVLYLIHPDLFLLTLGGVVLLTLVAVLNQQATARSAALAGDQSLGAMLAAQSFVRGAESIRAMGMTGSTMASWGNLEARSLNALDDLNRTNAFFSGLSRTLRMGLQIALLGLGAYLVLTGKMTAAMIFAASLISGRALQPIDQIIGGWKGFTETRKAWKRLSAAITAVSLERTLTDLPEPRGNLSLEGIVLAATVPGAEPILKRVSVALRAGECMVIIGPSGAGKSSLLRAVVGVVKLTAGTVRLDGADIRNWDPDRLGRFVGYLAQDVEILPGTIAQNIARFHPDAPGEAIVAAAKKAQVHEMVQRFPGGYDTLIGPGGIHLSGGQRQRIGLARALFGAPKLIVLDEPNANLDVEGEIALDRALATARESGATVLLVTQRRQVVDRADKVLILRDGAVEDLGPRDEVIARQAQRMRTAQEAWRSANTHAQNDGGASAAMVVPETYASAAGGGRFPAVIGGGRDVEPAV